MIGKFKIWQFIFVVLLAIVVIRFNYIINLFGLMFELIGGLLSGKSSISSLFSFNLIDHLCSSILILILLIGLALSKKIRSLLSLHINAAGMIITLLLIGFIFAPLITLQNPEFQKDISVTKLLPPFSSINFVELNEYNYKSNEIEKLKCKINQVIPESFNNSIIFFNEYKIEDKFIYYQAGSINEIELNKLKSKEGKPIIKSKIFLFGSDEFGRGVFARIIYGSRITLIVGIGAVFVSFLLGITFAFFAAEKGGVINLILSRFTDLFLAFPSIFLVILILALFGNNILSIIIVLGFSGWMSLFKIAKSEIASVKNKEYYLTAKLLGLKNNSLLIKEILPVIIVPVMVNLIFQFSNVILAESALSFLGLGTGNNYPSWGAMIESGQRYISQSWWLIFIPGFGLVLTLLSVNELGRKINKIINPTFE